MLYAVSKLFFKAEKYTRQKYCHPLLQDAEKAMVGFSKSGITAKTQLNGLKKNMLFDTKTVLFKYFKSIFCFEC